MKVLLDENLDIHLVDQLRVSNEVSHAATLGWKGRSNGDLLRAAVAAGFDVLITGDANIRYQQDIPTFDIAIVQLRPKRMLLAELIPLVPEILEVIESAARRTVTVVPGAS